MLLFGATVQLIQKERIYYILRLLWYFVHGEWNSFPKTENTVVSISRSVHVFFFFFFFLTNWIYLPQPCETKKDYFLHFCFRILKNYNWGFIPSKVETGSEIFVVTQHQISDWGDCHLLHILFSFVMLGFICGVRKKANCVRYVQDQDYFCMRIEILEEVQIIICNLPTQKYIWIPGFE